MGIKSGSPNFVHERHWKTNQCFTKIKTAEWNDITNLISRNPCPPSARFLVVEDSAGQIGSSKNAQK
jgi:hypothetical protein